MKKTLFCFLLILFIVPQQLNGQAAATPDIGANPYKSYSGGDFDHIQMQNGGLFLDIPLVSYPQLGALKLSFSLQANSSQYQEAFTCDQYGDCYFAFLFAPPGGQCNPLGDASGGIYGIDGSANARIVVDQDVKLNECTLEPVEADYWTYIDGEALYQVWDENFFNVFGVQDSTGASHALGYDQTNWSVLQATDGSGYSVQMPWANSFSAAANAPTPSCGYSINIREESGISHTTTSICNSLGVAPDGIPYDPSYVSTISDPLGNTMTRSSVIQTPNGSGGYTTAASSSIIDSIGRVIPDPTGIQGPGFILDPNTDACPNLNIPGEPVLLSVLWAPPSYQGTTSTYHFCYTSVVVLTNFFGNGPGAYDEYDSGQYCDDSGCLYLIMTQQDVSKSYYALQSIVLPNKQYWGFKYDTALSPTQTSYGDLLSVILPSGGSIDYSYNTINVCGIQYGNEIQPVTRAVATRTANPIVGSLIAKQYTYMEAPAAFSKAHTIETDSSGNDLVHEFTLDYPNGINVCGAKETATRWYQGSSNLATSGTILKEVDTSYTDAMNPQDDYSNDYRSHINVLPQTTTTYLNGQQQSSISYGYDTLFTASQPYTVNGGTTPYLFPTTSGIRYQTPTFVDDGIAQNSVTRLAAVNGAYKTANILGLPQTVVKRDESGNPLSTTTYGYDEAPSPQGTYGNLTSVLRDYGVKTTNQYDNVGMPCETVDAKSNVTYYYYGSVGPCGSVSPNVAGLYVTSIQAPSTSGASHIRYFQQDQNTGWLTAATDENASSATDSNHATFYNYDVMGRLTSASYPDHGQATQCYTDVGGPGCSQTSPPYSVVTQRLESTTDTLASQVNYDGLGRVISSTGPDAASTNTTYDATGRIAYVTNPHFSGPSSTDGVTSFLYDALGRKAYQCQPDNGSSNPYICSPSSSYLSWSYNGNTTTSRDEVGNISTGTTDAHGRLVNVVEASGFITTYTYNALDNLLGVNQQGIGSDTPRIRSFTYDALSRLVCASNPENSSASCPTTASGNYVPGTTGYTYDPNGNLLSKTAPQPNAQPGSSQTVTTNYTYDALNRMVAKTYSNAPVGTPSSCYQYDDVASQANGIGRPWFEWTQPGACPSSSGLSAPPTSGYQSLRTFLTYDPVGRIKKEQQCTPGACTATTQPYTLHYDYDLVGHLVHASDGIGQAGWYSSYDNTGRLMGVSAHTLWPTQFYPSQLFSAVPTPNCLQPYTAAGALSGWTSGSNSGGPALTGCRTYDQRERSTSEMVTGHD